LRGESTLRVGAGVADFATFAIAVAADLAPLAVAAAGFLVGVVALGTVFRFAVVAAAGVVETDGATGRTGAGGAGALVAGAKRGRATPGRIMLVVALGVVGAETGCDSRSVRSRLWGAPRKEITGDTRVTASWA
jgi:hypothetical protein